MPESRVFRPKSEAEDTLIAQLIKVHFLEGHIQRESWTQYAAWLINRDLIEIRARHKGRISVS